MKLLDTWHDGNGKFTRHMRMRKANYEVYWMHWKIYWNAQNIYWTAR